MKMLRDLRLSTKMLILFELTGDPKTKLKPLAEKFDMTVQGVSEYIKLMESEELVQRMPGEYRLTPKGVQELHNNILELRDFVVKAVNRLEIIRVCTAVARTRIKKGDRVGLFMENGILVAYAGRHSHSIGIAAADARSGDGVPVRNLEGIVDLVQGRLVIIELPTIGEKKKSEQSLKNASSLLAKLRYDRLGALDTTGLIHATKLGVRCDFEFAAGSAGIEAAQKGLDVVLMGSADEINRLVTVIEEMNTKASNRLRFELLRLH